MIDLPKEVERAVYCVNCGTWGNRPKTAKECLIQFNKKHKWVMSLEVVSSWHKKQKEILEGILLRMFADKVNELEKQGWLLENQKSGLVGCLWKPLKFREIIHDAVFSGSGCDAVTNVPQLPSQSSATTKKVIENAMKVSDNVLKKLDEDIKALKECSPSQEPEKKDGVLRK